MFLSHFIWMRKVCGGEIERYLRRLDKEKQRGERDAEIFIIDLTDGRLFGFRWAEQLFLFRESAEEIF